MACDNCKDKNIVTPIYTQATPPSSKGCNVCGAGGIGGGGVIIPPGSGGSGGGNITIVEAGNQISVDDNSYPGVDSFKVHYAPYTALTANISSLPYVGGILQSGLVLFGKIVDEVITTWSYNKANVATQALTNDGGFTEPALVPADRDFTHTAIVLIVKTIFTITGNDGVGQTGSIASKTATVDFGNIIMWGDYTDMVGQLEAEIDNLVTSLLTQSTIISNTKARSVFATGGQNRNFFYLLPKRLGEVIFSKNNFVGGFYRLKLVSGALKSVLVGGDVESDIIIVNSAGYSEAYYLYQSSSDDQADAIVPFVIV